MGEENRLTEANYVCQLQSFEIGNEAAVWDNCMKCPSSELAFDQDDVPMLFCEYIAPE